VPNNSHERDCVVAGFRWHKGGEKTRVDSLLLGLGGARDPQHRRHESDVGVLS